MGERKVSINTISPLLLYYYLGVFLNVFLSMGACRSSTWQDRIVLQTFGPTDWYENFRMGQSTFDYLCNKLRPTILKQNTSFRKSISVEQRVAITLWCLATPCEYRTVAVDQTCVG